MCSGKPGQAFDIQLRRLCDKVLPAKAEWGDACRRQQGARRSCCRGLQHNEEKRCDRSHLRVKSTDLANRSTSMPPLHCRARFLGVQVINNLVHLVRSDNPCPWIFIQWKEWSSAYRRRTESCRHRLSGRRKHRDYGKSSKMQRPQPLWCRGRKWRYPYYYQERKEGRWEINFSSQFSITSLAKKLKCWMQYYIQYETRANSSFKDCLTKY